MKRTDGQKRLSARLTHRKAFTLVELLVVIAIIGILFVVLISKVDFATEKAKATGVQTDFRSYQLAIETVARENAGLSTLVDDEASGEEKYAALEAALNKNLDPKLRVEIDADGKISTDAKDPWKEEYTGQYLAPDADGTVKDRGAIVMYCKGSNLKLGTTSETVNGVVNVTIESGKEAEGADDYAISTIYTYVNGYGEIQTKTEGFSNDIGNIGDTINTPSGDGELDEDVIIEIWMVDRGEVINFTDLLRQDGATINTHLVDTLPDTMIPLDMENGVMDAYILESTGVIYGNLNGAVMTLGQLMADGAAEGTAFDKGWSEDIYSETEDGFYCVRVKVSELVEVVQIWSVVDGENPTNLEDSILENGGIFKTYAVDELPAVFLQSDEVQPKINAYVLVDTGVVYLKVDEMVITLGQFVYDGATGFDRGWSTNVYYETEPGIYCVRALVRPETPVATNGGFYDADGNLLADWDTLVNEYGMNAVKDNDVVMDDNWDPIVTTTAAPCNILANYFPATTKVVISDTVSKIGAYAFSGCVGLTSVEFGSGVTEIGLCAFEDCTGLMSISIPDNVTLIDESCFNDCTGLTSVDFGFGVRTINAGAFDKCSGLTSVFIPNSVTFMGHTAFRDCSNLTSVTIGSGVKIIGDYAFTGCNNLAAIVVDDANTTFHDDGNCLIETASKTLVAGCKNSIIPTDGSVTIIGDNAFYRCTGLTSIVIPEGVTTIGHEAFGLCFGLTGELIVPDSVTTIGESAFVSCNGLTKVEIGSNVTTIDEYSFNSCGGLETFTIESTTPPVLGSYTFSYCSNLTVIYVPAESVEAYRIAGGWSEYADKIQAIPTT